MTAKCGCCNAPLDDDATCPEQHNRLHVKLKQAQEELSAWHQEFTVTVNGKPYPLDPIEAGKMVQDAEAEARMATQDKEQAQEEREHWKTKTQEVLAAAIETDEEREAAIERGAKVCDYVSVLMAWGQALDRARQAAERDAAKQRALAEKYRGALEQFSLWLEQECKRGTLDLGFGPDWSAKKVQSALDRLLAPAEAQKEGD